MKFKDITPELLYELTKEVLKEYKVDSGCCNVDPDEYLKVVCYELLEKYSVLGDEERAISMLSANAALVLENFLLHLRSMKT